MSGPLTYLAGRSARNRLLRQLRRLRTPRYALALALGLAYLWAVGVGQRPSSRSDVSPDAIELIAAAGVTLALLWTWVFGADRRALAFSRAEVTWLFPAPVTRAQLIRYKLLRGQFVVAINVLVWTILLSRGWAGGEPWRRAGGIWILMTTLAMHRLGVALFRQSLAEHGRAGFRVRAVSLAMLGIVAAVALFDIVTAAPALRQAWDHGMQALMLAAREVAERPATAALLLPARLLVRPLLAPTWLEWVSALWPALALLAAHYVWVVRSDAAFEESAAAAALARAGGLREAGSSRRFLVRPVPALAPDGWPGGALLWKNLTAVARAARARTVVLGFALAAVVIAVLAVGGRGATALEILGWMAALWAGFLLVLGPQWIRNDLRSDLPRLALLRSYPLRGRTVVAAEAAGSAIVLTALQLGLVCLAYFAFWAGGTHDPDPALRTAVLGASIAFLPSINFLAMLIQNGAALLLPAWVHLGEGRPMGVEALGHNMLVMVGFTAVLALLLLTPVVLAGAVFLGLEGLMDRWAAGLGALVGIGIAALEARLILARLGRVFESTDPASVPAGDEV